MPPHLENVRFCQHVFVCFLHFGHIFKNKCIFLQPLGSLLALWAPLGQLWRPIGETKALPPEMSIHTSPFRDPFWGHLFSHSSIFSEKTGFPEQYRKQDNFLSNFGPILITHNPCFLSSRLLPLCPHVCVCFLHFGHIFDTE